MAYNDVYIGINYSHDASAAVMHKGKLLYYRGEDRYNRQKSTSALGKCLTEAFDIARDIAKEQDVKIITVVSSIIYWGRHNISCDEHAHDTFKLSYDVLMGIGWENSEYRHLMHHECHAGLSFYNSGFDEAICLVIDGGGGAVPSYNAVREAESIYYMNYNDTEYLYQRGSLVGTDLLKEQFGVVTPTKSKFKKTDVMMLPTYGGQFKNVGYLVCEKYVKKPLWKNSSDSASDSAGKVMGLSAYGKPNKNFPNLAFFDKFPTTRFAKFIQSFLFINGNVAYPEKYKELPKDVPPEDIAYAVQSQSTEAVFEYIEYALSLKPNVKNMCLSGGFFYNVVNNYKILKKFPNINFFFEPIAGDQGTALGSAMLAYRRDTGDKEKRPLTTVCLGSQANYERDLYPNEKEIHGVTPKDVAELIADRNVVAIYQGRTECGPRALGNRSILYDPRDPDGRDVVNKIKKREWYRPFAGTVLEECAHDWFDMANLKSSPWMMFAVDCYEEKRDIVPALQHNDGTSRIQTVTSEQNKHYYDLISEFYKLTGIPMVLNTSFNLAGDVIVNNMEQACYTCRDGKIPYLYCPEREMLIQFF
jgi:carbamoyltransferase